MSHPLDQTRPGSLTLLGIVSLIWSALTLAGSLFGAVVLLLIGAATWLGGPWVGAIGSIFVALILAWLIVASALSILLLVAGFRTLKDDPEGIRLHRIWAWISLGLDAAGLIMSGGTAPNSWTGIAYACAVLYVTSRPEVLAYFGVGPEVGTAKPQAWVDDLS